MDRRDKEALRLICKAIISLMNAGQLSEVEMKRVHRAYRMLMNCFNLEK